VWVRGVPDHDRYDHPPDVADYLIGIGSLPNHHCQLHSLGYTYDGEPYRDARGIVDDDDDGGKKNSNKGNEKFSDADSDVGGAMVGPGSGAYSYSVGRDFYATRDLLPGEEIVSYDDE
jgi:hypothetical protein